MINWCKIRVGNSKAVVQLHVHLMKIMKNISAYGFRIGYAYLLVMSIMACKESDLRKSIDEAGPKPDKVQVAEVENLHGGAKISFSLPDNSNLLYVQADYEIRPGVRQQSVSSSYGDFVILQGFSDVVDYTVSLTVVGRGGEKSDPVDVVVHPLTPPVKDVYSSLSYVEDFGGITVNFGNQTQADLSVSVLTKDSVGYWVDYDRYYTSRPEGMFPVRGLPARPTTFGVYVTDRWGNSSDTLVQKLTPLYEEEFSKSKFKGLNLPGDAKNSWAIEGIWDNITAVGQGGFSNQDAPFPKGFNFDIGAKSKLSRLRLWGVHDGREFSGGNVKVFELWGSNSPSADGSLDGWELMGQFEVIKPSGLVGQLTSEDIEAAANGMDFSIPVSAPEVRYLRFRIISTFASPPNSTLGASWVLELSLWGQEIK